MSRLIRNPRRASSEKPDVQLARSDAEILATYDAMKSLRPTVKRADYLRLVRVQQDEVHYQLAFLRCPEGEVVSVAGFRLCRSLGWGRFLYVDDLSTKEGSRSKGFGMRVFRWLVDYARRKACQEIRLDSAVTRHAAHRFYLRERMDIACFNFRLDLAARLDKEHDIN